MMKKLSNFSLKHVGKKTRLSFLKRSNNTCFVTSTCAKKENSFLEKKFQVF